MSCSVQTTVPLTDTYFTSNVSRVSVVMVATAVALSLVSDTLPSSQVMWYSVEGLELKLHLITPLVQQSASLDLNSSLDMYVVWRPTSGLK